MRPYPKLMCSIENPDGLIVFFQNPNSGMVVHSDGVEEPLGLIDLHWDAATFRDVDDEVVIWLTEGPKDAICEAIEMIDKISKIKHLSLDLTSDNPQSDSDQ